jgi:uncharacterized membrane protein
MSEPSTSSSLRAPGIVLGAGLGGFVDGIVLHQILQWHHMLTGTARYSAKTVRGLEVNTLWDGFFHAAALVLVITGLAMLSRGRRGVRRRPLVGWALVGWGLFNLVEGIVDHHILGIHHVRAGPDQLAYDLAFLALGAVLVLSGYRLAKSADA